MRLVAEAGEEEEGRGVAAEGDGVLLAGQVHAVDEGVAEASDRGQGEAPVGVALEDRDEATLSVSSSGEGRHATTTRKLYRLSSGGVLLDIPGIRLVDLMSGQDGVDETFSDISEIATRCRFRDCAHNGDEGCAVQAAVDSGELPASRLENWRLIQSQMSNQTRRRDPATSAAKRKRPKRSSG